MRQGKQVPILVFYGYKGAGKDTCFEIVASKSPSVKVSFADELRDTCWRLFGNKIVKRERIYGAIKDKEEPILGWEIPQSVRTSCGFTENFWSGRRLLQWFGTDVCRTIYQEIWVDKAVERINEYRDAGVVSAVCITDCRFYNEYCALTSLGAVFIKVERGAQGNSEFASHASEKDIPDFQYKYRVNNSYSKEYLAACVETIMDKELR